MADVLDAFPHLQIHNCKYNNKKSHALIKLFTPTGSN